MAFYPGSIATDANLYIAVNGLQTTLSSNITSSQTSIPIQSTTNFPTTGAVTINNAEVVFYTGISGGQLTGCTRGADGTTALAANLGQTVGLTIVAAHHNLLKNEIEAIETALGVNLANVFPATPTTGTGDVVLQTAPTINSPVLTSPALGTPASGTLSNCTGLPISGGTTGTLPDNRTTATPNATASTIVERDANANTKVNTIVENFSTTVTAGGTTALTAATSPIQQFTGTSAQTVTLPDCTTLSTGYQITILNRSTGLVTVNNNGGSLQETMAAGSQTTFTCTNIGSANGTWDVSTSSGSSGVIAQYQEYTIGTASGTYTGSLSVFNLPFAYMNNGATIQVIYNGQVLTVGIDYAETNSTTITTNYNLVSGGIIAFKSLAGGATSSAVTYVRENYVVGTALNNYTGSLTVFNLVNTYTPGGTNLSVYVDGDLQTVGASIDYQETNTTTVTFNNNLVSGQKVSFLFSQAVAPGGTVSTGTANTLAAYPASGATVNSISADTSAQGHKITSLGAGVAQTDAANVSQLKYLQTVQSTTASQNSTSSGTFSSTALTGTLPSLATTSSRVLVRLQINARITANNGEAIGDIQILRGATIIYTLNNYQTYKTNQAVNLWTDVTGMIEYIDSPATTGSVTYTLQIAATGGGLVSFGINPAGNSGCTMSLSEVI